MSDKKSDEQAIKYMPLFLGSFCECIFYEDFCIKIQIQNEGREEKFITQFPTVVKSLNFPTVYFAILKKEDTPKLYNKLFPCKDENSKDKQVDERMIERDNYIKNECIVEYKDFDLMQEMDKAFLVYADIDSIQTMEDANELYNRFLKFIDVGIIFNGALTNEWEIEQIENKNSEGEKEYFFSLYSFEQFNKIIVENALGPDDIDIISYICLISTVYDLKVSLLPRYDFSRLKDRFIYYFFSTHYKGSFCTSNNSFIKNETDNKKNSHCVEIFLTTKPDSKIQLLTKNKHFIYGGNKEFKWK